MSTSANSLLQYAAIRFALVGGAAAGVHFCTVLLLVQGGNWSPLIANVLAFLTAFQVSYWGHKVWSFKQQDTSHAQSLPRFFLVASASFVLNEFLYFLLLRYTHLPYWLALGMVLVAVALLTFFASKAWAFAAH